MRIASVILAAGQGTRMRSNIPKVLHTLCGKPMIHYAVETAQKVTGSDPIVIVGYEAETIRQSLGGGIRTVLQEPQLGTGHAVMQAEPLLRGQADLVLVSYADMPLLTEATLLRLVKTYEAHPGPIVVLSVIGEDPRGFGRIVRDAGGDVVAIIEEAQASPEQLAIRELNVSAYCFAADWLWDALHRIQLSPKGEYYLTDLVEIAIKDGRRVQAVQTDDLAETIGINTRVHLAEAEALMRQRINRQWMLEGVTLIDPATTYIEPEVTIGQDTILWPNTHLRGNTAIGVGCTIGPNTIIQDTKIGNRVKVFSSVVEKAVIEDEVDVGPYGHLRSGAHLARGVHMGNFGEVKNSYLGPGSKMGHFSYLGDAELGPDVNVGAGTITCNFDGYRKHRTEVGKGVFIGSDTMLVAPVKLGDGARTGAGAVVTKDVPPHSLAVGVPARVIRKLEPCE